MKILFLFLVALVLLGTIADARKSRKAGSDSKAHKFINLLKQQRTRLNKVLNGMRADVNKTLVELFPHLKPKLKKLKNITGECYDQNIGKNQTVNIFEGKIRKTIVKFFKSNGHLFENYTIAEIKPRVKAFIQNLATLADLLIDCVTQKAKGKPTMKIGLTSMTIYSPEEIKGSLNPNLLKHSQTYAASHNTTGLLKSGYSNPQTDPCSLYRRPSEKGRLPQRFSWQDDGYVTPVYHQATCGSCYVFATTSALESQVLIQARNKPIFEQAHFSVQATLNCMSNGCGGGSLQEPFQHFIDKGVTKDRACSYIDATERCQAYPVEVKADKYCYHQGLSDEDIQWLILRNGPAAIAISAQSKELMFLKDEPYTKYCDANVDHAVLMVGWDEEYWIIKNSWGTGWGRSGFLYLPRRQNKCGVNTMFGQIIINPVTLSF